MQTISQKRDRVRAEYPNSTSWKESVAKMPDSQIVALYFKFTGPKKPKEKT